MTFDRPILLVLAAAALCVWWFRRRAQTATVTVSSVAPFRGGEGAPVVAPRRSPDAATWFAIAAAVALAPAAAGARIGGGARPRVLVVVDESPSMLAMPGAADTPPAGTVRDLALAETIARVESVGLEPVVRSAGGGDPAAAAAALSAALGFRAAWIVTDRAVPAPHVAASASRPAGPNIGITAIDAERGDGTVLVRIEDFGAGPVDVEVTCGGDRRVVRLALRGSADVALRRPHGAGEVRISPGGSLAADDVLALHEPSPPRCVRVEADGAADRTVRALRAAGFEVVRTGPGAAVVAVGKSAAGTPWIVLAAPPGTYGGLTVTGSPSEAAGGALSGDPDLAPRLPAAGGSYRATGRISGGRRIFGDPEGALAAETEGGVAVTLDPEGAWGDDPSFPVFLMAVTDRLLGPAPATAATPLPRTACDVPTAALPRPSDDALRALAGPPSDEGTSLVPWLAAAAAACALGAALAGRR